LSAEGDDKLGGQRDSGLIFQQERETFRELDDETGTKLAGEINLDEFEVVAGELTGRSGAGSGHPGEDA
jgi:hypothetical protein